MTDSLTLEFLRMCHYICSAHTSHIFIDYRQVNSELHSIKRQVFHTVHLSSIILRIINRCHFFVIFLYYMSLPYMFRASTSPSSGVFPAVATCCHLVHVVLGVCLRASGSFDVLVILNIILERCTV